MKYNIHHAINYRSYRKGFVNFQSLNFLFKSIQFGGGITNDPNNLSICKVPNHKYGIYYPNVLGKTHSAYPENL